ncbi:hypothetical protein ABMA58_18470 [Oceanospirillum sp. HFRX-1_2]
MTGKEPPARSMLECLVKSVFGCSFLISPVLYLMIFLPDFQWQTADNGEGIYELVRSVIVITFYTSIVCFVIAATYGLLVYKLLSLFRLNNYLSAFLIGAFPGALFAYPFWPYLGIVALTLGIFVALSFHYLHRKTR